MIYLDHAATTPVDKDIINAMLPYYTEQWGNPSSLYAHGRRARRAVEKAREQCARALNCSPEEIFFTSGATEGNNWILKSDFIYSCTPIEHRSVNVLCCDNLPVDENGIMASNLLCYYCDRIAVALVNNEIGTVQSLEAVNKRLVDDKLLHIDATQAIGKVKIDLTEMNYITSLALSGHKIGTPKGIGLLYVRKSVQEDIEKLLFGGHQENGMRAGTENVAGIVGLGVAMQKIADKNNEFDFTHLTEMKNRLIEGLSEIPRVRFNALCEQQLPHYLSVSFKGIEGEALLLRLDAHGICVSAGSACNSGSIEPSHVLKAIGVPKDYINGSIRITMSDDNTMAEIEETIKIITDEVAKLRENSPSWKGNEADDSN